MTLILAGVIGVVVIATQLVLALGLLDPDVLFEAGHAKGTLVVNAVLALVTVAIAAFAPDRWRALALFPGALVACAMLGASVTLGGHAWDATIGLLTLTSSWWIGRIALRALHVPAVRGIVVVEVAIGFMVVGMVVLFFGRLHILAWWNAGLLTVLSGLAGVTVAARASVAVRRQTWVAVTASPLGVAAAGIVLLQLGWIVVWLSAPEIMYDALYAKAAVPELWAGSGRIGSSLVHPVLNSLGVAEVIAVSGHTLGSDDVGRWMQLGAWLLLVPTVWWWAGPRSAVGPLAAVAVAVVPQLMWEAATAFDDLVVAVGVVALALVVLRTADRNAAPGTLRAAILIGLLAGGAIWLKLHVLALVVVMAVAWAVVAGPWKQAPMRTLGVALGGLLATAPMFVLRWIDTGNPVFPTYNELFRSPYYPSINDQFNFPFWPGAGLSDALKAGYEAVVQPALMNEVAAPGSFGLLMPALVLALLIGWRRRGDGGVAVLVIWISLVVAVVMWWSQFRYLRYLIPAGLVSVILLSTQIRGWRPGRAATLVSLLAMTCASAFYLPSAVAIFWNVPNRDLPYAAAFGRWETDDYLRTVFPEKDALAAFQKVAPSGAIAVTAAHERTFLHGRDVSPPFEVTTLLQLSGPLPSESAIDDVYRRVRQLGIGWAIITDTNPADTYYPWVRQLAETHGEVQFSDRGWTLYRLVDRPDTHVRPVRPCDSRLLGKPGCWNGTFDATPGVRAGESASGVNRNVPVCPGQIVGVRLTAATGGAPSQIVLNGVGAGALSGHMIQAVPPGSTRWGYATVPPDVYEMNVAIIPGEGATVTRADVGTIGDCAE